MLHGCVGGGATNCSLLIQCPQHAWLMAAMIASSLSPWDGHCCIAAARGEPLLPLSSSLHLSPRACFVDVWEEGLRILSSSSSNTLEKFGGWMQCWHRHSQPGRATAASLPPVGQYRRPPTICAHTYMIHNVLSLALRRCVVLADVVVYFDSNLTLRCGGCGCI